MRRALLSGVTVLAAAVGLSGQASQPNSSVGTWKLNLAKSKFEPASLAPKSMTSKIEAVGDRTRNTTEGVDANGRKIAYGYTISYDGKDYPITGTGPSG